jgi:hypothetical protein
MQKKPVTLAIVGKNLHSCVAALHLSDKLGSNLSWFQTLKDPETASDDQLMILTPLQRNQLKIPIENESLTDNPKVFIGSHRHYPIDHILKYIRTDLSDCPYLKREHRSVLAKAIGAGFWNDLNPSVLTPSGAPRSKWIEESPPTSKDWEAGAFSILKRQQLFQATESKLLQKLARVDFEKKRVLGIDRSSFNDGVGLIFNAPFGSQQFQALLWTSVLYPVKEEGDKKARLEMNPATKSIAFWKTYSCDIDSRAVGFLPLLSIWLSEDEQGSSFRRSGLMSSGAIRRVACVPNADTATHRLQIQSLHFYDNPRDYERPDSFLWGYCPNLKSLNPSFLNSKVEENLIFKSPFSLHQKLSNRFDFWMGGVDCGFSKVPKYQWGIESRRRKRNPDQPVEIQR